MNKKGSVLVHVLVTGVIVSLITAGVMRMTMMSYVATARGTKGAQNRKEADALLQRTITYWNQNGVCSTVTGFAACGGSAGTCGCDCPSSHPVGTAYIHAYASGGSCVIELNSSDPP